MNSLRRRRDCTFKFLLRKQIEQGEKDTKARTLYRDEKEKREVEASLHVRVLRKKALATTTLPPGPLPGHSPWGTLTHHGKKGPNAPSKVRELTGGAVCSSADYLEANHWRKGESGLTPQASARLV